MIEISIVMPCLNEADTVVSCIQKAHQAIGRLAVEGEIIVADNGSTDQSVALAEGAGARVVHVQRRGYGSALMGGIESARGKFVLMGDADESYDFGDLEKFLIPLRRGAEVVQGCRLPGGGGTVSRGAMPFLHRWWGNPMFTLLAKWWFKSPVNDIYCGLRGFRRDWWLSINQRCTGMEFATEMLIKASLMGAKITEVPITLYPDGRKSHAPHLKTFRDGWRTLKFFLLCTPRWVFLVPGGSILLLGLAGYALALPGVNIRGAQIGPHSLLVASLAILCGWQAIIFGVCTKTFAVKEEFLPPDPRLNGFLKILNLERSLILSSFLMLIGIALIGSVAYQWRQTGFGQLNYSQTMRWVVPGATLTALGFQSFLASFLISILGTDRR